MSQPAPRSASTVAWFNCFAGIAGDMALASLVDAGADPDEIRSALRRLPISGWNLEFRPVLRGGLAATQAVVTVSDTATERTYPELCALVDGAGLPPRVTSRSLSVLTAIATAEATMHRSELAAVHLHELGGHDTVIDIVGSVVALELLDVDIVRASAVAVGRGTIATRHGLLPNPGPAVVALLSGAPIVGVDRDVELTTPTGAGLLAALADGFGPMPSLVVRRSGYGAGARDLDGLPNCTQVVVGELGAEGAAGPGSHPYPTVGQALTVLEANLDDATGEQLADAITALLAGGAADAWITPVVMKKGRPGHIVSVLCDPSLAAQLRTVLVEETGTFGVRHVAVDRWSAARTMETVSVSGFEIRVKVSSNRVKFEHDDLVAAATATGRTTADVLHEAERAYSRAQRDPGPA